MKIRIIKISGVFRVQIYAMRSDGNRHWSYVNEDPIGGFFKRLFYECIPMGFPTQKGAEKYVEDNYVVKVVKEYEA